ncbi:hypothetical protein TIFTF001_006746 [Ficus carica]|uniref:Uncharacterized protein n=1 Tax=Ficus carica TaxID=3494 RepID=A0AA88ABY3_FICCA|nr:hypothetical protein TIFTF001_006746 [Ficus carica]
MTFEPLHSKPSLVYCAPSRPFVSHVPCLLFTNLVLLPTGVNLLADLASHSPPNHELGGLASQLLSNRNTKLGTGHGGERIFDGEGRPRGEQGGGGS